MDEECDDVRLTRQLQRGDVAALAQVYEAHASHVFSLARRILDDGLRAGKVVEEVFVRLWEEAEEYDARQGSIRAHLLGLARARSHELLAGLHPVQPGPEAGGASRRPPPEVDVLPEHEAQAIELAYFGGHSCMEIAELLGVPADAVRRHIRLGLKRVRLAMPDERDN